MQLDSVNLIKRTGAESRAGRSGCLSVTTHATTHGGQAFAFGSCKLLIL